MSNTNPSPTGVVAPPAAGSIAPSNDGVFSLDDLDKIIEAEDPDFKKNLDSIKEQAVESSAALENLSVTTEDEGLSKEKDKEEYEQKGFFKRVFLFLLKPWFWLREYMHLRWLGFKNRALIFKDEAKDFIRHQLPEYLKYLRSRIYAGFIFLLFEIKKLKTLSRGQWLALIVMISSGAGAVYFLYKSLGGNLLPRWESGLVTSLNKSSPVKGEVKAPADMQDLFQAFPEIEYYVLLKKIVVNLSKDEDSSKRPMGAFEVFIAADSQDTAIEIKDREEEFADAVQRTLESFKYSDARTKLGKVRMKSAMRDRLNEIINQGRIQNVYFNFFVIYE